MANKRITDLNNASSLRGDEKFIVDQVTPSCISGQDTVQANLADIQSFVLTNAPFLSATGNVNIDGTVNIDGNITADSNLTIGSDITTRNIVANRNITANGQILSGTSDLYDIFYTGLSGRGNLQQITDNGSTTTNNLTAESLIKANGFDIINDNDTIGYLSAGVPLTDIFVNAGGGGVGTLAQVTGNGATTTASLSVGNLSANKIIGNSFTNVAPATGAFVGGGSSNSALSIDSVVGSGELNTIAAPGIKSVIVGGNANNICATRSFIGGGDSNFVRLSGSSVVGGIANNATGDNAFIGGGTENEATSGHSAVVGGEDNCSKGAHAIVGAGQNNVTFGNKSFIGSGQNNDVRGARAAIVAGCQNFVCSDNSGILTGTLNRISTTGQGSAIIAGTQNEIVEPSACTTIIGGQQNTVCGNYSTILGGQDNTLSGDNSGILGGCSNNNIGFCNTFIVGKNINADASNTLFINNLCAIGGAGPFGSGTVTATQIISSGTASGETSALEDIFLTASSGASNLQQVAAAGNTTTLGLSVGNLSAYGTISTTGGASPNFNIGSKGTTIGGFHNYNVADSGTIMGGSKNSLSGVNGFIGGGCNNTINTCATHGSIIGGTFNDALSTYGAAVGGTRNTVRGEAAAIVGGCFNWACGTNTGIFGGRCNLVYGEDSVIIGGKTNHLCGTTGTTPNNQASAILGGCCNTVKLAKNGIILGGQSGYVSGQQFNSVLGGNNNRIVVPGCAGCYDTIVTGCDNSIQSSSSDYAFIGGGRHNQITLGNFGTIINGVSGLNRGSWSFLGSGCCNHVCGNLASIVGGKNNKTTQSSSFIGGGQNNQTYGQGAFVGGGFGNKSNKSCTTVGGGHCNQITGNDSGFGAIIGGQCNSTTAKYAVVGGGLGNKVNARCSAILGGHHNCLGSTATNSFILGSTLSATSPDTLYTNNLSATGGLSATDTVFDTNLVTNETRYVGASGENALIQKNPLAGRDELQLYAAGDAYSTNSRGAGIHLYGNDDSEHAGNIAFLTGHDDNGEGRMIIAGGGGANSRVESNTHITIGNNGADIGGQSGITNIWDFVDGNHDADRGMLNLINPIDGPAIYIAGAGATEGDIAVQAGEALQIGTWDPTQSAGSEFTKRLSISSTGQINFANVATSSSGLAAGDIWNDNGTLKIVS